MPKVSRCSILVLGVLLWSASGVCQGDQTVGPEEWPGEWVADSYSTLYGTNNKKWAESHGFRYCSGTWCGLLITQVSRLCVLNGLSTNMNWFQDDQIWKPVLRALFWSLYGLLIPQVSSYIHLVYFVLICFRITRLGILYCERCYGTWCGLLITQVGRLCVLNDLSTNRNWFQDD